MGGIITIVASVYGWRWWRKRCHVHGQTDDFGFNVIADPVPVHDLNATIMHLLESNHLRLTYRFQGRDYRLTDVHGEVVQGLLA